MAIRDQMADFCFNLKFEDLPPDVVEFTRLLIMDQVGLTVAAATLNPEVERLGIPRFNREMGGTEESSLVTQGCKVPCLNAVFSNTMIGFGGFDGMHRAAIHLPCCLIAAAIAVAERQHAGGRDLILATVAGAEVIARVAAALGASNLYARGFHPTSISGPIGCAAAAGKLLGLSADGLAQAISIAAVHGAGARPWTETPRHPHTQRIQVGRASQSGVLAALLSQLGVVGIRGIFEDPQGFLTGHSANPDPAKLTEDLGKVFEIKYITLKRFGVGIYIIPGIEALLSLMREHRIRPDNIAGMTYKLPTAVIPLVGRPGYPAAGSLGGSSLSSKYVLAVAAYSDEDAMSFSLRHNTDAALKDPRHIELFKRIDVVAGPELDRFFPGSWPCTVIVRTKEGREFSRFHNGTVKGSPENPFTPEEMESRFRKIVTPELGKQRCDRMLDLLRRLPELNDISELAELMAGARP
ncbi:MAG: MmgE/PrpD family protein [Chloroflexi bacterium]|nr:MmgE/PrpD family protein [Chloroflexota bacterium]